MRLSWNNFTSFSLLLHFREKNGVLHWKCSKTCKYFSGRHANASREAETSKRESTEG